MRPPLFAAAALLAAAAPASAQEEAPANGPEPSRVNQLIVYGEDDCPPSNEDEIIVCARLPEDERYRIPEAFRGNPRDRASESWTNRAIELSYVGRTGIGSCSPVGPGGFIGCHNELVRQARAEREGSGDINWNRLVEEARQNRQRRIDREAEEIEQSQSDDD